MRPPVPIRVRFGEYEVDRHANTLRRHGQPVKIQPQPLRVLLALIEKAGEVVTRDELRARIWDEATFVEFDQGLNYSLRQIRMALRDDVAMPIFIETLPKRGYRFIGKVEFDLPLEPLEVQNFVVGSRQLPSDGIVLAPVKEEEVQGQNTVGERTPAASKSPGAKDAIADAHKQRQPIWVSRKVVVALAIGAVGLSLTAWNFREVHQAAPEHPSLRFFVSPTENIKLSGIVLPVISPDGERLMFGGVGPDGKTTLWVRRLSSFSAELIPGSEGAASAFWSPDSRSVGFFTSGKLERSDLDGAPPRILCSASSTYRPVGTWSREGIIIFNSDDRLGLYQVPATGGAVSHVTSLDTTRQETLHAWPQFLPDGRHFIFLVESEKQENGGIYVAAIDSKEKKRVIDLSTNPSYAGLSTVSGYLLFVQGTTLMAQVFDLNRLELRGERVPIAEQIWLPPAPVRGFATFSASQNGVLVYRTLGQATSQLTWFDRQGRQIGTVGEPGSFSIPALSPDERVLAIARTDPQLGTKDLWLYDLAHATNSRFTFDPVEETNPTWSPDGKWIAFSSFQKGHIDILQKSATGAGSAIAIVESKERKIIESWTPDGKSILYNASGKEWAIPWGGNRQAEAVFEGNSESRVTVSPDMKWIAYDSRESGRSEVYVQSFPRHGSKWQVSTVGGQEPYWRRDGREIFYVDGSKLMAVNLSIEAGSLHLGAPKQLFDMRIQPDGYRSRYQVAGNGQKFLVNVPLEPMSSPITVVTNWASGIAQRAK